MGDRLHGVQPARPAGRRWRRPRDFRTVTRLGPVMPPEDKDAALFPRRFDGRWAMIHRPTPLRGGAHMWVSYSPDLRHWGDHTLLLEARDGAWWDAGKIGLGPPPLRDRRGLARHVPRRPPDRRPGRSTASGSRCSTSTTRRVVLRRSDEWVFGPSAPYERERRRRPGRVPVRLGPRRGDATACSCTTAPPTPRSASRRRRCPDVMAYLRRAPRRSRAERRTTQARLVEPARSRAARPGSIRRPDWR